MVSRSRFVNRILDRVLRRVEIAGYACRVGIGRTKSRANVRVLARCYRGLGEG